MVIHKMSEVRLRPDVVGTSCFFLNYIYKNVFIYLAIVFYFDGVEYFFYMVCTESFLPNFRKANRLCVSLCDKSYAADLTSYACYVTLHSVLFAQL